VAVDLVKAEKIGRTIMYSLKMSVLKEALISFAQAFGLQIMPETTFNHKRRRKRERS
jgi:hypothetical protein